MIITDTTTNDHASLGTLNVGDTFKYGGQLYARCETPMEADRPDWHIAVFNLSASRITDLDDDTQVQRVFVHLTVQHISNEPTVTIVDYARNSKIQAIKALRSITGWGLKESKAAIDAIQNYGTPSQVTATQWASLDDHYEGVLHCS